MSEVVDWIFDNAFAIVGGVVLLVVALGLFAWANRREHERNAKRLEDKDPREGE